MLSHYTIEISTGSTTIKNITATTSGLRDLPPPPVVPLTDLPMLKDRRRELCKKNVRGHPR